MDDMIRMEASRRKILDNAEARLRYIREGIPWRTPEISNDPSPSNANSAEEPIENGVEVEGPDEIRNGIDAEYGAEEYPQFRDTMEEILIKTENILFNLQDSNQQQVHHQDSANDNESLIYFDGNIAEPVQDLSHRNQSGSTVINRNVINTSQNINEDRIQSDNITHSKTNIEGTQITNDPVKILRDLLTESSNERREHKKKIKDQNWNLRVSCFLMLALGILIRISYEIGLSWMFGEIMLMPFATLAVLRLISVAFDPPPPSGVLAQVLIMSGIKIKVIKKAFTVITVLRNFLQLFSVYLVAFLLTNQVFEFIT